MCVREREEFYFSRRYRSSTSILVRMNRRNEKKATRSRRKLHLCEQDVLFSYSPCYWVKSTRSNSFSILVNVHVTWVMRMRFYWRILTDRFSFSFFLNRYTIFSLRINESHICTQMKHVHRSRCKCWRHDYTSCSGSWCVCHFVSVSLSCSTCSSQWLMLICLHSVLSGEETISRRVTSSDIEYKVRNLCCTLEWVNHCCRQRNGRETAATDCFSSTFCLVTGNTSLTEAASPHWRLCLHMSQWEWRMRKRRRKKICANVSSLNHGREGAAMKRQNNRMYEQWRWAKRRRRKKWNHLKVKERSLQWKMRQE